MLRIDLFPRMDLKWISRINMFIMPHRHIKSAFLRKPIFFCNEMYLLISSARTIEVFQIIKLVLSAVSFAGARRRWFHC
jgi:hypothetical protein